jgi:hypothetical protein
MIDADPAGEKATTNFCNGHPMCNCTTTTGSTVGLHGRCPVGNASDVSSGGIVSAFKAQMGADAFCTNCLQGECAPSAASAASVLDPYIA